MIKTQIKAQTDEANEVSNRSTNLKRGRGQFGGEGRGRARGRGRSRGGSSNPSKPNSKPGAQKCERCGGNHSSKARETCNCCHKQGHFKKMCRKRPSKEAGEVEQAPVDMGQGESKPFFIQEGKVSCFDSEDAWTTELRVGGTNVTFKIDSEADISVMSADIYNPPLLRSTSAMLSSPGGKLKCAGEFTASGQRKDTSYSFRVIVVSSYSNNLMSRTESQKMVRYHA